MKAWIEYMPSGAFLEITCESDPLVDSEAGKE